MNRKSLIKELEYLSGQVNDFYRWQIERDKDLNESGYWSLNNVSDYDEVEHGLIASFVVKLEGNEKVDEKMAANIKLAVLMRNHLPTIIEALKVAENERAGN